MTRSTLKAVSGMLLAAGFALALAACGQSAAPTEQSEAPAPPTTNATAAPASAVSAATAEPTSAPAAPVESTPVVTLPTGELPATSAPTSTPAGEAKPRPIAKDIPNVEGIDAWLNTDMELTIQELVGEGNVVLVDFWTYTCVNCIRTLPFLRDWWSQYEDDGLVILGIHTPEFEFEKDYENVSEALMTHDIGWPVAQDNNMVTWRNFENRYWPAKYLFNSHGEMIYSHFGEGAYGETEQKIRNALVEAGADLSDDPQDLPEDQVRDAAFQSARTSGNAPVTPELYAGWQRNVGVARAGRHPYVAQYEDYFQSILDDGSGIIDVQVPQDLHPHLLYFQGIWSVEPERIRHGRKTEMLEDYLALNYAAKSVNAVLTSDSGEPYEVVVTVDGAMLTEENAGADIQWDENGYSYILVDEPRMYGIVDNPQYLPQSILTMRSNSDDFGLFAFTFGVYAEGP
ncbi:MAG: redoxin domain-containing protein [Chloroflexota bacterium]|nr:redoxin domain-containing protein [Chloroflexota bacterium]MDE2958949.1 redoxin domain-containing protein [Chloroflexota bacterium]